MGGVVAIQAAVLYPERVDKLVLVDTDMQGFPISSEMAEAIMKTHLVINKGDTERAAEMWLTSAMKLTIQPAALCAVRKKNNRNH